MAKQKLHKSLSGALTTILNDKDVSDSVGAVKFTTVTGETAYFYMRYGRIYSVYSSTYTPDYVTRLFQSGDINSQNLEKINNIFKGDLFNKDILNYMSDSKMVPESTLEAVTQDFFLYIFADVMSWQDVYSEWRKNETNNTFTISPKTFNQIADVLKRRQKFIADTEKLVGASSLELMESIFISKREALFDEETPLIFHQLMSEVNNSKTFKETSRMFGLTTFRVIQSIRTLWELDLVTIETQNRKTIPANPNFIEEPDKEAIKGPIKEPEIVISENYVIPDDVVLEPENESTPKLEEFMKKNPRPHSKSQTRMLRTPSVTVEDRNVELSKIKAEANELIKEFEQETIIREEPQQKAANKMTINDISDIDALVAQIQKRLSVKKNEMNAAKAEVDRAEEEIKRWEAEKQQLDAKISTVKQKITANRQKTTELEAEYKAIISKISSL